MEQRPAFLTYAELEAGLSNLRASPADGGTLHLIVARSAIDARTVLNEALLDPSVGLIGDNWRERLDSRPASDAPPRFADVDSQLNIMNFRAIFLLCPDPDRRPLAGDQLYIDLDLSYANLPWGSRFHLGEATIEVTAKPHTGCRKFRDRFGLEALKFVNSEHGRALNLRGINAKVVRGGRIRVGDVAKKLES